MARWWLVALAVAALIPIAVLLFFYLGQRSLQYFPSHVDARGEGQGELRPWRTGRGVLLGYCRAAASPPATVLFFHGNGGEALHRAWLFEVLPPSVTVCLVEYPGYGGRVGRPTEAALFAAAEEAYDEALRLAKAPVLVIGESLGTGVASYLASRRPIARLALISPFASLEEVAARHYPWLPVRLLLRDRYLSLSHLADVRVPLHVVHGAADLIVPLESGRRLFDGYRGAEKTLTVLPGVGHNDIAEAILHSPTAAPFRTFLH